MSQPSTNPSIPSKQRTLFPLALALTLVVLTAVIAAATLQLRDQTRRQIAARDAEIFHAVALMYADEPEIELLGIDDPENQLAIVLQTSSLKAVRRGTNHSIVQWRVLAARLFDPHGRLVYAFPDNVLPAILPAEELPSLHRLEASATFHRAVPLSSVLMDLEPDAASEEGPILEINVPLHTSQSTEVAGIAQFLIEAQSMADQLDRLDRNLILQALVAFLVSGGLLAGTITWSFRRLQTSNRQLADQAEHLRRANLELALAAKTSALGTVTAHLLHGLKNPLSGLQNFMNNLHNPDADVGDYDRAVASTRRMQTMINQVINILRESQNTTTYEVTAEELAGVVREQVHPILHETGAGLDMPSPAPAAWSNRVAQLSILILTNLVQNALQASPRGTTVRVETESTDQAYTWRVLDQGPGFPEGQQPFTPCQSVKDGGSGIGLALSKQLANHLQAKLDLVANRPTGCHFTLELPGLLQTPKSERAASNRMG